MVMNKLWKTGKGAAILILRASRNPPGRKAERLIPSCVKQSENGGTLANKLRCINPVFWCKTPGLYPDFCEGNEYRLC